MATTISNFYPGTTKNFSVTITLNGAAPDIRNDTVTLRIKASHTVDDAGAALTKAADVATSGVNGIALFTLTPAETAIPEAQYVCDIVWVRASGAEYVIYDSPIQVLKRVSDP